MRELERLGTAEPAGSARWVLASDAGERLRAPGERATSSWSLENAGDDPPIVGRRIAKKLGEEPIGSAFAIVDGVNGRVHHLRLADLDAGTGGKVGAVVEMRRYENRAGRARLASTVRSDLDFEAQVSASAATWIDRQLVAARL